MATKTITLTGAEVAVTGLDGAHAHIRNDGTEVIYAAKTAGITAGADGVASIPAGQSDTIRGISGTVYLLGTGSVLIQSDDYVVSPFKSTVTLGSVTEEITRAVSNPNLLINYDFAINQRGASGTITTRGYFVDRWKLVDGSVTINSDGTLTLDGTISQTLENAVGTNITASANAGTASYDGSTKAFSLTAFGETILWAKLEIGGIATPFTPPDPAAELAKCQRYFYAVPYGRDRCIGNVTSDGVGIVFLPLPTTMRTTPTVLNSDGSEIKMQVTNGDNSILSDIPVTQVTLAPNGIIFALSSDSFTKGQTLVGYHQRTEDNSALSMLIAAEL